MILNNFPTNSLEFLCIKLNYLKIRRVVQLSIISVFFYIFLVFLLSKTFNIILILEVMADILVLLLEVLQSFTI